MQIIAIMLRCGLKNVHGKELLTILLILMMENCGLKNVDNPVGVGYGVGVQVEEWRCWLRC